MHGRDVTKWFEQIGGLDESWPIPPSLDLVAFCQLRWNFVWQRPNHLMTRFAKNRRVFFIEEPLFDSDHDSIDLTTSPQGVQIVVPHLTTADSFPENMRKLLDTFFFDHHIEKYLLWYWTPMAIPYSRHLEPILTIYDCMDELASFADAPKQIRELDFELLSKAEVAFTGGHSLFEARRYLHPNIHPFPSSIDGFHFNQARNWELAPDDQKPITGPKLGFFGVIDERFDRDLLKTVAEKRPDWQFVLIGPIVKVDPALLPRAENIHYLGKKAYEELPAYLAGWDVALLPFAKNDATRFISPTKTPEYLAAGIPVVSTSIRDVVRPYAELKLVWIADTPDDFIEAVENALQQKQDSQWLQRVDSFLSRLSWDDTVSAMERVIVRSLKNRLIPAEKKFLEPTPLQEEQNV